MKKIEFLSSDCEIYEPFQQDNLTFTDEELLDSYSKSVIHASSIVSPAVVNINVSLKGRNNRRMQGGSGSGFIFTPDGFILTNSHVVHNALKLEVILSAAILPAQNICFAMAINTSKFVAGKLIKDGKIKRSYIGIAGQNVPIHRRIVRFYNLLVDKGILITSVERNSPAQKSGLSEGDIIIGFDEQPISGIDDLHKMLTDIQVGKKSNIRILRRTEIMDIEIIPSERLS